MTKRFTLFAFIALASNAAAQSAPGTAPAFRSRGAFFALSVADLGTSTRWYAEKLGLEVVMHPPKQNKSEVTLLEGGGLIVDLLQLDDAMPLAKAAPSVTANHQVHGLIKAGVIVEDFDATVATLRARGVTIAFGPFPASATQRANVIIRDNAGNLIRFFGPGLDRPRDRD